MKSLRLQFTALALLAAFAFGPPGATPASAQPPFVLYCIHATSTPCIVASQVGTGTQGDDGWLFSGKINANFAALPGELYTTGILLPAHGGTGDATLTGVPKGNGTSPFTAAAAADIVALFSTCSGSQYLGADGACHNAAGAGTVTSIGETVPAFLSVSPSTITTSGTFAISLSGTALPAANGGTGVTSLGAGIGTFLSTPSSANLAAALTDETGTGVMVANNAPTLINPALKGSSTGVTTLASANAGASNFTATVPAATDTVVELAQTQTLTNKSIAASEVNSGTLAAAQMPALTGDATSTSGTVATTVAKINGTALSGLATGILKNTTATGVPSIATSADIISDFSGTCSSATFLRGDGSCQTPAGGGSVSTTGTPATGNLSKFSGATTITNGDLSGDVTTAGALATTVVKINGAAVPASAALLASNGSSQPTAVTLGGGMVIASAVLNTTAPERTVTTSPTVASTDMGGQINANVTGGGTLTIPAVSSTVFASGMSLSVVNYSASTMTVTTTPTVNAGGGCVSGTGVPAGDSWQMISNGTSIDCFQTISSGGGGGSGTVASSTTGQVPVYTGGTTVTGSANATLAGGALTLGVSGTAGSVKMGNATSGTLTVQPATGALGAAVISIPAATDTVALLAATQTLTNKSIAASEVNSGTLAAGQMPALTGDVTSTSGTVATTVVQVEGAVIPTSAAILATNGSKQLVAATTATFMIDAGTTFTLGTGTGACATTSTLTGGTSIGKFTCTGTAGASTQPIVLPTAPHGWACYASDITSGVSWAQSATSTTGCTVKGAIATTSDAVVFAAVGY